MLSLVETDNDRTVDVRVGDVVRITLPENASTGYRWAIDRYGEDIVEALGSEPRYPAGTHGRLRRRDCVHLQGQPAPARSR